MKVYVVSIDWAHDGDCESVYGCGVREVYAKKEDALIALNRIVGEEFKNSPYIKKYQVERTATEFISGEDGCFSEEHFCVYVSEREVYV